MAVSVEWALEFERKHGHNWAKEDWVPFVQSKIEEHRDEPATVYRLKASLALDSFNYKDALEMYDRALSYEPKNVAALYEKAQLLLILGNFNESERLLRKALVYKNISPKSVYPSDLSIRLAKATTLQLASRFTQARQEYEGVLNIISAAENSDDLSLNMVVAVNKTVALLEDTRVIPYLEAELGRCYLGEGAYENAVWALKKSSEKLIAVRHLLKQSGDDMLLASVLTDLGKAYVVTAQFASADRALKQAQKLVPPVVSLVPPDEVTTRIYLWRGILYAAEGSADKAEKYLAIAHTNYVRRKEEHSDGNFVALLQLASTLFHEGRLEESSQIADRLRQLRPTTPATESMISFLLLEAQQKLAKDNVEAAREILGEAYDLLKALGSSGSHLRAYVLYVDAVVDRTRNHTAQATQKLREAAVLTEAMRPEDPVRASIARLLGEAK
ncbi:MAG: tetratricopeptide repeat protein [Gammaproteobacteria bacterium]